MTIEEQNRRLRRRSPADLTAQPEPARAWSAVPDPEPIPPMWEPPVPHRTGNPAAAAPPSDSPPIFQPPAPSSPRPPSAHPAPVPAHQPAPAIQPAMRATAASEPSTLDELLAAPANEGDDHDRPRRSPKAPRQPRTPPPPKPPKGARGGDGGRGEGPSHPPRPSRAEKPRADRLTIGGVPRVDLLPPELRAARDWRVARNQALIAVLLTAILLLGGVGTVSWWARTIDGARAAAQARTVELQSQQGEFAEVNQLLGAIRQTRTGLETAQATDVEWRPLLAELQAGVPDGARITSLTVEANSPVQEAPVPTDPLRAQRVAGVTFTAVTSTVPDAVAWSRAMLQVSGVVYASPRSIVADEAGQQYTVEMSIDISADRLRNQPEEDAE